MLSCAKSWTAGVKYSRIAESSSTDLALPPATISSPQPSVPPIQSWSLDDVDTEAATALGVMVCHAPTESNCFGVAETTIAFMLSLLKKVAERDADVRAGKWRTADNFAYYVGSRASDGFPGQTIGLVGLGRIGTRVAQLLAPWRARIIAYDPYVPPAHFLTHGVTAG